MLDTAISDGIISNGDTVIMEYVQDLSESLQGLDNYFDNSKG